MIELQRAKLSKAIAKAKRVRNHVRMIAWRKYEVTTPESHIYTVTFDVRGGRRLADCTCPAGLKNLPCYHIAGAVALHCHIARTKAAAEPICDMPLARPQKLPRTLVKPQPPSLGRLNGFEL